MTPTRPHLPVMLAEVLTALSPKAGEVHLDGTFGNGGYSQGLLDAAACTVWATDRDPSARPRGDEMEAANPGRFTLVSGCFGDMDRLLADRGVSQVDGIALDLGVSSMQLDHAERGFSFQKDGPLDMRMGREGLTAADLVNSLDEGDLADVIYLYGEERHSRRIARALVERRAETPFTRTGDLADVVRSVMRKGKDGIDPATRTFQALRIKVNDELGELERGLRAAERLLAPGGRLVVVSFHSLEDRVVKAFLRRRCGESEGISRHMPAPTAIRDPAPTFQALSRRTTKPGAEETRANPRARSARLRAAARTDAAAWPEHDEQKGGSR
ncbi:MAG: 16S rRNA (cytosine(1402)-N(4))-methyltransferase RsmH [Rhodospirillum sp.]|nr:16S rRNA (cytosine(1402)-N(4))-methyltransferase RsmH [Rhodospirillum sp.]MCF8488794.1 16S rRNA (cytosine(1402)-N(4))-methyltransferase RsmH [Rhodospirillum sp.]MCF8502222.1 16S rRNA (cytosine(1402)-N(4))-methyltransferase RsmH [Rhodospirillum sp.]